MHLVSGSQCKHQDSSSLTIQSKTCPPLFHTTADVPSRHAYELPSAFHLNCSVPIKQKPSNLHHNLRDNVMHIFHADMLNHYMMITQHHLIHFYIVVWVSKVGWTTRASQAFSTAPTLFEPCPNSPHTHASFENECLLVLHFLHTESG